MIIAVILILAVVLIFGFLLLFPFRYRVMAHCDLLHNHLLFSVRAANIRVMSGSIRAFGNRLYLNTAKREVALKIVAPATDREAVASYIPSELPRLSVKKINLYTQTGKSDDAFFTAMLTGVLRMLSLSMLSVLRLHHKKMIADYDFEPLFNIDHLQITLNCIVSISVANIIRAVRLSLKQHKKSLNGGRNDYKRKTTA